MPVRVMVGLEVKPEKVDDLEAHMPAIPGDTRRFTGCEFGAPRHTRTRPMGLFGVDRRSRTALGWPGSLGRLVNGRATGDRVLDLFREGRERLDGRRAGVTLATPRASSVGASSVPGEPDRRGDAVATPIAD